jgi:hypothetical protein
VQNPVIALLAGLYAMIDAILVVLRLAYQAPAIIGHSEAGVLNASIRRAAVEFLGGIFVLSFAGLLLLSRWQCVRAQGARFVCVSRDRENGAGYAVFNLLMIFVLRVCMAVTRSRMLQTREVGCVVFAGELFLPMTQMLTMLFFAVLLYAADLHGVYRPSTALRYATLAVAASIGALDVAASAATWGPSVITNS